MAFLPRCADGIRKTLAATEFFANQLQREEGGVTFVQVKERGIVPELAQQFDATDAEHHLLHNARGAVAAVDPEG